MSLPLCHQNSSTIFLTNKPRAHIQTAISQDPHCYPFWDDSLKVDYSHHLLPQLTSEKVDKSSWFSQKHFGSTSMSTAEHDLPIQDVQPTRISLNSEIVRKIRVYPSVRQKIKLAQMAGTSRFVYNRVTAMIRDKCVPFDTVEARSAKILARQLSHQDRGKTGDYKETSHPWWNFQYMRNFLVNNHSSFVNEHPWMKDTPNSVRQVAVQEGIANYKAALSNLKAGNIKHFDAPFRRKANRAWSIGFDPTQLRGNQLLPGGDFGRLKVAEPQGLRSRYKRQFRITRDKYKRYFLVLVEDRVASSRAETSPLPTVAIDPGIRTRHVVYSTRNNGEMTEIGNGDIQRIVRVAKFVDKKISASCARDCNHQRRRRLLKQRLKLTARVADLKKEMDWKTIRYLETHASQVLLPAFDVHSMASRLRHKSARALLSWGHGLFKQRLMEKARRSSLKVMIVSEHYTSKTCGQCGFMDNSLGSKKKYSCPRCDFKAPRDWNGARNILLRAMRRAH